MLFLLLAHTVAGLAEALRYRLEGQGFSAQWNHRNFLMT
jgi:hypothetical protein